MKALVAFNQEKALVGAFSVITNLRMELFEALMHYTNLTLRQFVLVNVVVAVLMKHLEESHKQVCDTRIPSTSLSSLYGNAIPIHIYVLLKLIVQ